jgi:hypothetical protein
MKNLFLSAALMLALAANATTVNYSVNDKATSSLCQ